MDDVTRARILVMLPLLDEKQRRLYLAAEVNGLGPDGLMAVHELTGVSEATIVRGQEDLSRGFDLAGAGRIRAHRTVDRESLAQKYAPIKEELEKIVAADIGGSSENVLVWVVKSLRELEAELHKRGFKISHKLVRNLLIELGYHFQQNKKLVHVDPSHKARNAQFAYINQKASQFIAQNQPVILVNVQEKTLSETFKYNNIVYNKETGLLEVLDSPVFQLKTLNSVDLYDTCSLNENTRFVNMGESDDVECFSVACVLRWWQTLLVHTFVGASKIFVVCDDGGVNGERLKLWKWQLQEFADISGLEVHVAHFPSGTFRWNRVVDTMFCYVRKSCGGEPCVSIEVSVQVISSMVAPKDVKAVNVVDRVFYKLSTEFADEALASISLEADVFHGNSNYIIHPK